MNKHHKLINTSIRKSISRQLPPQTPIISILWANKKASWYRPAAPMGVVIQHEVIGLEERQWNAAALRAVVRGEGLRASQGAATLKRWYPTPTIHRRLRRSQLIHGSPFQHHCGCRPSSTNNRLISLFSLVYLLFLQVAIATSTG